jgi:hypothetical protein
MVAESMAAFRADRKKVTLHGAFVVLAAMAALILSPAVSIAAKPVGSGPGGKSPAVTLESIPGSAAKRVILTAKAAERLGIRTDKVSMAPIVLKQMVSGLIIPPMEHRPVPIPAGGVFGGLAQEAAPPATAPAGGVFGDLGRGRAMPEPKPAGGVLGAFGSKAEASAATPAAAVTRPAAPRSPAKGDVWVLVTLSPAEWDRLAKNKPARLLPLATRDKLGKEVLAKPSGIPPMEDMKRSMLSLYYKVPGKDHGLAVNDRMRVELQMSGNQEKKKVVPYGAVYYDAKGAAWVYVNTNPLTFERRRVAVERVVENLAVLSDGPPVGTPVVTVGAALLYGAEIFGK